MSAFKKLPHFEESGRDGGHLATLARLLGPHPLVVVDIKKALSHYMILSKMNVSHQAHPGGNVLMPI
jgi:hypothetical protein